MGILTLHCFCFLIISLTFPFLYYFHNIPSLFDSFQYIFQFKTISNTFLHFSILSNSFLQFSPIPIHSFDFHNFLYIPLSSTISNFQMHSFNFQSFPIHFFNVQQFLMHSFNFQYFPIHSFNLRQFRTHFCNVR